jgi:thymidylate kinase
MCKYICIEGVEGVGKTTQTQLLADHLKFKGYKVLQTKEPGTPLVPLTMELRNLMLNAAFDKEMTIEARELISQTIRSIHIKNLIIPALDQYDFIIQDRGVLSGLSYGRACGNNAGWLGDLSMHINYPLLKALNRTMHLSQLYDHVVYLTSDNVAEKLNIAKNSKQEFEAGDAIELKGSKFMLDVRDNMDIYSQRFNTVKINIDNKGILQVFDLIVSALNVK